MVKFIYFLFQNRIPTVYWSIDVYFFRDMKCWLVKGRTASLYNKHLFT